MRRIARRHRGVAAAIALAALLFAPPVPAQSPDAAATAERAATMLEAAAEELTRARGARDRIEALTRTVRAYEEGLQALREGTRQAALRERSILLAFEAERARLARLLAVLQRIESQPAPVLLLHPDGPLGTARAGMIVADVTPSVAREALALRAQLEELALLRALQGSAVDQLQDGLIGVQTARADLSQAIADRRDLPMRFSLDADAMRQLLESVDSLDSFAELLRAAPTVAPGDLPSFAEARGDLRLPVLGTALRRFGESDAAGVARPGLVLATRANALVTAPWPASVRYSGPLLDYGNVIILEPQADYLLVMAGLGDLYVRPGELVAGDAPLGLMPGPETGGLELIVTEGDGAGAALTETLYIEVRTTTGPADPETWFRVN